MADTEMFKDLIEIQHDLYRFYERHRKDFPTNAFIDAFSDADDAVQIMIGEMEDESHAD